MQEVHLEMNACNVSIIFTSFQPVWKWLQFFINFSNIMDHENLFSNFQVPFVQPDNQNDI
jgi:hypothetical protein